MWHILVTLKLESILNYNNSCVSSCNAPFCASIDHINGFQYCDKCHQIITKEEGSLVALGAGIINVGVTSGAIGTLALLMMHGPSPALFNYQGFLKMLSYIRYMDIKYPPRLEVILNNINATFITLNFGPVITPEVQSHFKKYNLPGKFDRYGFHSSFFVNYWQNMTSMGIILGVILLLAILIKLTNKGSLCQQILLRLKLILKWNFALMVFCTNLDGVILSTSLEMRTVVINSFPAFMSMITCVAFNILTLFLCLD